MKIKTISSAIVLSVLVASNSLPAFSQSKNIKQPHLGTRSVKLIEVDGF